MCNRHYENWRLRGDPVPERDLPLGERIRNIGWDVTSSGCYEWRGSRNDQSYALFNNQRVHRLIYEIDRGVSLSGLDIVRHSCDNPPCVNPDHLLLGDHKDNMADMVERRRHWKHGRAHCPNGHDLSRPGAVKVTKRENLCVRCDAARKQRYQDKKKMATVGTA